MGKNLSALVSWISDVVLIHLGYHQSVKMTNLHLDTQSNLQILAKRWNRFDFIESFPFQASKETFKLLLAEAGVCCIADAITKALPSQWARSSMPS